MATTFVDLQQQIKTQLHQTEEVIYDEAIAYQHKALEHLNITYEKQLIDVKISVLNRPIYHTRKPIENRIKAIYDSLQNYGFLGGIFIQADSLNVIDGWYRSEIWHQIGNETIPCYLINCTDLQERELHLKLNTQFTVFDFSSFGLNFEGLKLIEDFGFSEEDLKPAEQPQQSIMKERQKPVLEGMTRLSTTIRSDAYEKLNNFKEKQHLENIGDAIEKLIELI